MEVRHIVVQSVFLATIVRKTKLAFVKNAKILASIHVDPMLSVMWSLIPLIVAANKVIKVTHLLAVTEFRKQLLKPAIHAYHPPVEKMLNVLNETEWQDAHAFHHTSAMLIPLVVVRNVYSMPTVPAIWLVSNSIVAIHAEESVDKTLSVLSSIIYPFVRVREVIKAIHLLDVD